METWVLVLRFQLFSALFHQVFEEEAEETQYAVLYLVALKYRWQCDFFIITFVPLNVIGLVFSSK